MAVKASALAAVAPAVTREQVDLVRRTIFPDATDPELQLFLHDCARRGVHPLDRLVHPTKRGGRYTPITSVDFMRSQAAGTGDMAGTDDAQFIIDEEGQVVAATVTVYRMTQGQRFAYTATARWAEYYPGDGGQGAMWRKMPHTMLGKCAEALALRKAFPQQLGGLYAPEELHQADRLEPLPDRRDRLGRMDPSTGLDLPKGYRVIHQYRLEGQWHHVYLADPPAHYKTKLPKIGALLKRAYDEKLPVSLDVSPNKTKGEAGYINRVDFLESADELAALEATRAETDDPPA